MVACGVSEAPAPTAPTQDGGIDTSAPPPPPPPACPEPCEPSCTNGVEDGRESDVDCGGACGKCVEGKGCLSADDCTTGVCTSGKCAAPACDDGVMNGAETATDCGGATCPKCVDGLGCGGSNDCQSGVCLAGQCRPATCIDQNLNGTETDLNCGGLCPECDDGKACKAGGDCKSGVCKGDVCVPCSATAPCPTGRVCKSGTCSPCSSRSECGPGQACVAGACGPCTANAQCDATQACVGGSCTSCSTNAQCGAGQVCTFGACFTGSDVPMYQCPASQGLGGGSWAYYGCQSHLASTPTCTVIEYPNQATQTCTAVGKLAIVTGNAPAPAGMTFVAMYQCPASASLGGGAWGFYGCESQVTSMSSCTVIEYPNTASQACTPIGKMLLASAPPAAPPGGQNVPMYRCPTLGLGSLGGGSWGYYGCQGQIASTAACSTIEYPSSTSSACTPVGSLQLRP